MRRVLRGMAMMPGIHLASPVHRTERPICDMTQTSAIPSRERKRYRRLEPGKARFLSAHCCAVRLRTREGVPAGELGDEGREEVHK